ncbi:MAG: hypothetical protein IJU05_05485 [Schwartzia sp.]|nr:hypothetical protein [Schwartzia sp. (in: firmicutes)]
MLRELSRILAQLKGERFTGGLIAKAVWRRGDEGPEGLNVLRDRKTTVVACARIGDTTLTTTMLLGRLASPDASPTDVAADLAKKSAEDVGAEGGARPWHTFTAEEIAAFVHDVNDVNVIHEGARPVVPGLILLEELLDTLGYGDVSELSMRFMVPAFAGEPLTLAEDGSGGFTIRGDNALITGTRK